MRAQSDLAEGLLYYRLVIDDEEVQAKFNPSRLPRTTMAPNVRVKLCQLLIDPETGYIRTAWDKFYYDGEKLFYCESSG